MSRLRATSLLVIAGLLLLGAGPAAHDHAVAPTGVHADGIAPAAAGPSGPEGCWLCRAGTSPIGPIAAETLLRASEAPVASLPPQVAAGADAERAGIPPTRAPPRSS